MSQNSKASRASFQQKNYGVGVEAEMMGDKSITKVSAVTAPRGEQGQRYLASGVKMSMRLWEKEAPGQAKPVSQREYETVGYVIDGKAELVIEGQVVLLEPGDCWVVPRGTSHSYRILEPFTAVEATSPPAEIHGRDRATPARSTPSA